MKQVKQLKSAVTLIAAGIFVVGCAAVQKQDESTSEFTKVIEQTLPDNVPGAIVYVVKQDEVILEYARGLADVSLQVPMEADVSFQIGSIAKQFTAVAILRLQEEGKLSLSDSVTQWLPEFSPQYDDTTLRHLLTHTSGIPNYLSLAAWRDQSRLPTDFASNHALYKDLPRQFPAGAAWNYSNSGYLMLAHIVELASGQPFNRYLEDELLARAGVTEIWAHESDRIYPKFASGYIPHGAGHRPADFYDPSQVLGAGGLIGTAQGLYQWTKAIHSGAILQSESLALAWQPYVLNSGQRTSAGLGWDVSSVRGARSIEHGGYFPGYFSFALWLPEQEVFVATFVNSRAYDPQELAVRVAAEAIGKPYPLLQEVAVTDHLVEHWQGVWQDSDGVVRTIGTIDGALYVQRGSGTAFRVQPGADGFLHYENSISYLKRGTDRGGEWLELHNRSGLVARAYRADVEPEHYQTIALTPAVIADMVGEYQIAPTFSLRVFTDNGGLYMQGTGQNAGRVLAVSDSMLIAEDLIAKFKFERDEQDMVTGLVILQAGQQIAAPKVR